MNYQAVLFDLDGTLVDSLDQYKIAMRQMFKDYGAEISEEKFWNLYTQYLHLPEFMERCGLDVSLESEFRVKRDQLYIERLREHVVWYPDAYELITGLKEMNMPMGIVTSSWRSYTDAINEKLNLYDQVPVCVTASDTDRKPKPDSRGLQMAADELGVDLARCIYVGELSVDCETARAAGIDFCLVEREHTPAELAEECSFVVEELGELWSVI